MCWACWNVMGAQSLATPSSNKLHLGIAYIALTLAILHLWQPDFDLQVHMTTHIRALPLIRMASTFSIIYTLWLAESFDILSGFFFQSSGKKEKVSKIYNSKDGRCKMQHINIAGIISAIVLSVDLVWLSLKSLSEVWHEMPSDESGKLDLFIISTMMYYFSLLIISVACVWCPISAVLGQFGELDEARQAEVTEQNAKARKAEVAKGNSNVSTSTTKGINTPPTAPSISELKPEIPYMLMSVLAFILAVLHLRQPSLDFGPYMTTHIPPFPLIRLAVPFSIIYTVWLTTVCGIFSSDEPDPIKDPPPPQERNAKPPKSTLSKIYGSQNGDRKLQHVLFTGVISAIVLSVDLVWLTWLPFVQDWWSEMPAYEYRNLSVEWDWIKLVIGVTIYYLILAIPIFIPCIPVVGLINMYRNTLSDPYDEGSKPTPEPTIPVSESSQTSVAEDIDTPPTIPPATPPATPTLSELKHKLLHSSPSNPSPTANPYPHDPSHPACTLTSQAYPESRAPPSTPRPLTPLSKLPNLPPSTQTPQEPQTPQKLHQIADRLFQHNIQVLALHRRTWAMERFDDDRAWKEMYEELHDRSVEMLEEVKRMMGL